MNRQAGGGVVVDAAQATTPSMVIVVPLDELLYDTEHIDVLKIDVEGFDTSVLEGCRNLLKAKRISTIFYEQNHPRMAAIQIDPERAKVFLNEMGYQTQVMSEASADVVEWMAWPMDKT